MIYDKHPNLQSKLDKAFWERVLRSNNRQSDGNCDKEIYRRTVRIVEERRKSEPLISGSDSNARNTALLGGHVVGPY